MTTAKQALRMLPREVRNRAGAAWLLEVIGGYTQAEIADALDERNEAVDESVAARAEADRIRRQADSLSDAADVPRDR
jgi:hypothetical protein